MPRAKACANTSAAIRRPSCPRTCARCWRSDQTPVSLHTLATAATHAVEVKHSRFLAHAVPVEDADAALQALAEVSVPDATHNCWAWRIGDDYRSNDDGEPAGTAGRPILAAIAGQGMDRVVVRSEEHTSELPSLMRIPYAVF